MPRPMKMARPAGTFPLEKWAEDESASFREPANWEQAQIERLMSQATLIWEPDGTRKVTNQPGLYDQESEKVLCVLTGCSVHYDGDVEDDYAGQLVFVPGVNCRDGAKVPDFQVRENFYKTWYALDPDLAEAIIIAMWDALPMWDPRPENQQGE